MQLLMYTDYALRALLYVGTHPAEPVPASAIARAYEISADHVAKATKALTRSGILRATRGAGGGVELAVPASEIRIGDVVRQFEGGPGLVDCLGDDPKPCRIDASCLLRGALRRAEEAFYAELDRYTLADLLVNRSQLVKLLGSANGPRS
jgi:Rrf2 family nitric oxide-sensitive transcriptional repressor